MRTQLSNLNASCRCGKVVLGTRGKAIVSAICYCSSCQQAGQTLEKLPEAPQVLNHDGGTALVLVRKDRVRCVLGQHLLQSPTRRMVATCCNSAMFLDFSKGHWLSLFGNRLLGGAPPPEMRVMTAHRSADEQLPGDVPNYAAHSGRLMCKLLGAWARMRFRSPKHIEGIQPT